MYCFTVILVVAVKSSSLSISVGNGILQKILYLRIDSLFNAICVSCNGIFSIIETVSSFISSVLSLSSFAPVFTYFSYFKIFVPLGKLDSAKSTKIEYEIATSVVLGFIIISKY